MNRTVTATLFILFSFAATLSAQVPVDVPLIPGQITHHPMTTQQVVVPSAEPAIQIPESTATSVEAPKSSEPVGMGSGLWKWTPAGDYHQSIVEVSTSGGSGTGVLISVNNSKTAKSGSEGYVLTAWHVVQDDIVDGSIKVTYRNKRRAKDCRVVQHDEEKDVAILWVWVPEDIKPAKLATKSVKRGDKLELAGLGGGTDLASCVRAFEAFASPPSSTEKIFADVPLLPGDSGGPVFNADHEVVGVISGGWFWWDSGLKTASGSYIRTTWPARASNIGPIQAMIDNLEPQARVAEAVIVENR
jgi:serine protease Do